MDAMPQKTVLRNGLRVWITPMPQTRSVSVAVFVAVGSRYEPDEMAGASHFVEHMLFKGTERRPNAQDIAKTIEGVGGMMNASTGRELTVYWTKVTPSHFPLALDLLIDMLRHSLFDETETEKERSVIIEEINNTLDTPSEWVGDLVNALLWPNHPVGRDVAGTRESVSRLSRDALLNYQASGYVPANAVVSIAGAIQYEDAVKEVETFLGDWSGMPTCSAPPVTDATGGFRLKIGHKVTEQAHFCLGVRALPRLHPDRFTLMVLNTILGEGMSSRLFVEIREKRGLAYDVGSYVNYMSDTGSLVIHAGVPVPKAPAAIEACIQEMVRLKEELVTPTELERAIEYAKGHLLLSLEDTLANASWVGRQEVLDHEVLSVDDVVARIQAVTAEEIHRVATTLFTTEALRLAVVGPFEDEAPFYAVLGL